MPLFGTLCIAVTNAPLSNKNPPLRGVFITSFSSLVPLLWNVISLTLSLHTKSGFMLCSTGNSSIINYNELLKSFRKLYASVHE